MKQKFFESFSIFLFSSLNSIKYINIKIHAKVSIITPNIIFKIAIFMSMKNERSISHLSHHLLRL